MRDKNIAIFKETLDICKHGSYKIGDETVTLKLSKTDMEQAVTLLSDELQRLMEDALNIGTNRPFIAERTSVYMKNSDSFEVARDIIPSYHRMREDSKSILVLNFANPVNPGGGVVEGENAQEEDLCRKSTLYTSLLSDEAKKCMIIIGKLESILEQII